MISVRMCGLPRLLHLECCSGCLRHTAPARQPDVDVPVVVGLRVVLDPFWEVIAIQTRIAGLAYDDDCIQDRRPKKKVCELTKQLFKFIKLYGCSNNQDTHA